MAYWEITNGDVLAFDAMNEIYEIIHLPCECLQGGVLSKLHDEVCYISKSSDDASNPCVMIYGGIGFGILKCTIFLEKVQGIEGNSLFQSLPYGEDGVLMILVGLFIYSYKLGSENFELKSNEGIGCWTQERKQGWGSIRKKPRPFVKPLVWIDLEMTGLNIDIDRIVEIAIIITDGKLARSIEGPDLVINQPKE